MKYNKLVRDRIPDIIERNGEVPDFEVLDDEKFYVELVKKLQEEVDEFVESGKLVELADILEVIIKLVELKGQDMLCLEDIRFEKQNKRGGFDKKIYLKGVGKL